MLKHGTSWIVLAGLLTAAPAQGGFKCWTNNEGVRECGNAVPPEYAQKETRTVNDRGITVEVRERAKTKEELAEEARRRRLEQQHLEAERRRRAERQRKDQVLLATFATADDIIIARDRKLRAIDGSIDLTRHAIGKLEGKVADYRKRAANFERRGKPAPDALVRDIGMLHEQIANKRAYIQSKRAEKRQLRKKYDEDLARFRELTRRGGDR